MEQIELFGEALTVPAVLIASVNTTYWTIVNRRGDLVLETNRKVPRLYATRQRAEEKIEQSMQEGKWKPKQFRLVEAL